MKTETVVKCFKIPVTDSSVISRIGEDVDPFAKLDAGQELSTLVPQIGRTCSCC